MSVGGRVIEVRAMRKAFGSPGVERIWVCDRDGTETAIYVEAKSGIRPGDQIWWQGRFAYHTPKDGGASDIPLTRYGYSFDPRSA